MPPADKPTPTPGRKPGPLSPGGWLALLVIAGFVAVIITVTNNRPSLTYTQFQHLYEAGQIKKLTIVGRDRATGEIRDPKSAAALDAKVEGGFEVNLPDADSREPMIKAIQQADAAARAKMPDPKPPEIVIDNATDPLPIFGSFVAPLLVLVAFAALLFFVILPRMRDSMGGGFLNSYTRSPAKRYEKSRGRITFEDVAGMDGAKRELQEVVDFLRNPDKFARLGAQVPKGVLLVGPPGTGKTLLAKAVAGEAQVPFFSINGSEFIQMFVGVGASRVRDLFKNAKEASPCVIFVDEIDAVGRMRGAGVGGGSDEREQTLNQILSEMDGFQASETVIVLAATNRPDVLDAALLRPGRFDRHVTVDKPTWKGRLAILKVHTRNKPLAEGIDLERVARGMIGMSGADLRNLCNEAALVATREGKTAIEQVDFDVAGDRVRLGAKREEAFSEEEKRRTAYHEAGHALCAWLEPKADPLARVSIIPREKTGGVTIFEANEDRVDISLSELNARLVVAMGGRAADRLVFGEPMSGAIGDLKQATRTARVMVTQLGMSERLGPVHYRAGEDHVFLGKEIAESRDFSEGTARIIDEEVQRILVAAEQRATDLLARNRADMDLIANALLVQEELDRDAIAVLLRKAPAGDKIRNPGDEPRGVIEATPNTGPTPNVGFAGA